MRRFLKYSLLVITSLGIVGICGIIAIYIWASQDLPSITKVHDYRPAQVTTVYARDNSILGYFYREKRFLVNLDQVSPNLINAMLAAEDADFYKHPGISVKGIIRAFFTNLKAGRTVSGGSTITQQVIKRLLLTPEKKITRKIQEAILAYRLEKYLSKNDILYIYLNQIYMGSGAYGVEAAARTYFGKHATDLSIAESAIIANLPQAPSRNNPFTNPDLAKHRPVGILRKMLDADFITQEEYDDALVEDLEYKSMPDPSWKMGAWYLEEVRRQLITLLSEENVKRLNIPLDLYGEDAVYEAGLHVRTAMDPVHQDAGEKALRAGLDNGYRRSGWHGPITNIPEEAIEAYLLDNEFTPDMLDNAGWAKAVVTKVSKDGADLKLGEYKGHVHVKYMDWARKPNLRVSPEGAGKVRDATKVLNPGDLIWVSAVGAVGEENPLGAPADPADKKGGIPPYNSGKVEKDKVLQLCLEQKSDLEGALASIEFPSGDLVALVGGYQYAIGNQFNRATQAKRQPGSAFKPVVYSAALDNGFTAGTMLQDTPFELIDPWTREVWRPSNFDRKFLGPIIFRTALTKSRNVCTVRLASQVGMPAVVRRAKDLGVQGEIPAVLAVSLGSWDVTPLEMAEVYSAFANNGEYVKPRTIISIANSWHEDLLRFEPDRRQAISPQNAYIMAHLLKDVVNAGTAWRVKSLGRPIGGKTGTSNEERAAWFIGISPYLSTSVYVGYDDHSPMGRLETGGRAAVPIFMDYRRVVDNLYEPEDFPIPPGITMVSVDPESGTPGPGLTLPFVSGTEHSLGSYQYFDENTTEIEIGEDLMKQMMF